MDWINTGKGYRTLIFGLLLALIGALEYVQGVASLPPGALMLIGASIVGLRAITTGPIFDGRKP